MTTAGHHIPTADELAAAAVTERLARIDGITIRRDPRLRAPYGVNRNDGLILLPQGLTWIQEHARIDRSWLYLTGGAELAPEFHDLERHNPDRHLTGAAASAPLTLVRRVW